MFTFSYLVFKIVRSRLWFISKWFRSYFKPSYLPDFAHTMNLGLQCIGFRILVNPFFKKGFHVHSLQRITILILRATSKNLLKKPFPTNIFFLTRTQCCPRWKSKILYPFYQGTNCTCLRIYGQQGYKHVCTISLIIFFLRRICKSKKQRQRTHGRNHGR